MRAALLPVLAALTLAAGLALLSGPIAAEPVDPVAWSTPLVSAQVSAVATSAALTQSTSVPRPWLHTLSHLQQLRAEVADLRRVVTQEGRYGRHRSSVP